MKRRNFFAPSIVTAVPKKIERYSIAGQPKAPLVSTRRSSSPRSVTGHLLSSRSPVVKRTLIYSSDSERESVSEVSLSKKRLSDELTSSVTLAKNDSVPKKGRSTSKSSITESKRIIKMVCVMLIQLEKLPLPKRGVPKPHQLPTNLKMMELRESLKTSRARSFSLSYVLLCQRRFNLE